MNRLFRNLMGLALAGGMLAGCEVQSGPAPVAYQPAPAPAVVYQPQPVLVVRPQPVQVYHPAPAYYAPRPQPAYNRPVTKTVVNVNVVDQNKTVNNTVNKTVNKTNVVDKTVNNTKIVKKPQFNN